MCNTLEGAKSLAKSKGLPVEEVTCCYGASCDGTGADCYMIEGLSSAEVKAQADAQMDRFFIRLAEQDGPINPI